MATRQQVLPPPLSSTLRFMMQDYAETLAVNYRDILLLQDNGIFLFIYFFLRDFIFKKTLFEKLQYLKQEWKLDSDDR